MFDLMERGGYVHMYARIGGALTKGWSEYGRKGTADNGNVGLTGVDRRAS
jgi:hypothetical protein